MTDTRPTAPTDPDHLDTLRAQVRECLDDEVLMRTGRSVGDIASGEVTDALLAGPLAPLVQAARERDTAHAALDRVRALADNLDREAVTLWHIYKSASPTDRRRANPHTEGMSDAYEVAADRIRRALDGGQP